MSGASHRRACEDVAPALGPGQTYDVPRPLGGRVWVDDGGARWHRRGDAPLPPRQARTLLHRPDASVMHVRGGPVHEHAGTDRESLVEAVEIFWAGDADPMTTFEVGEFRNDTHQVLAMVVEGC